MLKKLLLYSIMLNIVVGLCSTGCLKCLSDGQCVVCDTTSFYNYFGSCFRYSNPNCSVLGHDGLCNQCAADHYLDSNTLSCVPVPEEKRIPNCQLYDSQRLCIRCAAGFYVSQSACAVVPTAISNCESYNSAGGCSRCKVGYLYSPDRTACVAVPPIPNCAAFSFVKCFQCDDYHFPNPNLAYELFNGSRPSLILSSMQDIARGHVADWISLPTCVKVQDQHCRVPASLTTCAQCDDGYFVNASKVCELILPSLLNCETKRSDNNDCIKCEAFYYVNVQKRCSLREFTNCLEYVVDGDKCSKCKLEDYLVPEAKLCVTRTYFDCSAFDANADGCSECIGSKFLTVDKKCQTRTMTACREFSPTSDTCMSCILSTHYLNLSFKCIQRTGSARCTDFDEKADKCKRCSQFQANADNCNSCNQSQDYFDTTNETCVNRTPKNCKEFSQTSDSCLACNDGDYLKVEGSVKSCEINSAQNCLKKSTTENLCDSCLATAYREENLCKLYSVANCSLWSPTKNLCLFCPDNYFKNTLKSCVMYTISNCDLKDPNTNSCYLCKDGYWKNGADCSINTATNCLAKSRIANECASCPNKYYFNPSKSCIEITKINCDENVPNANECKICSNGYFLEGTNCTKFPEGVAHCIEYTGTETCKTCSSLYLTSQSKCSPMATNSFISDCIEYDNSASIVTCLRCISTKKVSLNTCIDRTTTIPDCQVYHSSLEKCQTCQTNKVPTSDGLQCLNLIDNCQEYEASSSASTALQCKQCAPGKYPNATKDACLDGNIYQCAEYTSATDCKSCNEGYYFFESQCDSHSATISNCSARSSIVKNVCAKCQSGYFPLTINSICVAVTLINNCLLYNSEGSKCTKCKATFYADDNGLCQNLPESCSQMKADASGCEICAPGYYLDESGACAVLPSNCKTISGVGPSCAVCASEYFLDAGSCIKPSSYITDQCLTFVETKSISTTNDGSTLCSICKQNAYPVNMGLGSVCVEPDKLKYKGISALVSDCLRYSNDPTPRCIECDSGKVIADAGATPTACADSCADGKVLVLDNLDGMYNACVTVAIVGCRVAVRTNIGDDSPSSFACVSGLANRWPVISDFAQDNTKIAHEIDLTGSKTFTTYPEKLHYYGIVASFEDISATNAAGESGDCELYWQVDLKHVCYRTTFGMAVTYVPQDGEIMASSSTSSIADCDINKKYTGYPSYLAALLSCNKCTISGNNLVVNIQLESDQSGPWKGLSPNTPSVECQSLPQEGETLSYSGSNCAVYGRFRSSDSAQVVVRCLACMPGYKNDTPDPVFKSVSSCTLISNCDSSSVKNTIVNRCGACNTGFDHKDANMNDCVEIDVNNCLLAGTLISNSSKYTCSQCKYGYFLNADGACESLVISSCDDTSISIFGAVSNSNLSKYLVFEAIAQKKAQGCNQCTNKSLVRLPHAEKQCVSSPYVTTGIFPFSTYYIANCASYTFAMLSSPSIHGCEKCSASYIPLMNKSQCVAEISNCVFADNTQTTKCGKCNTDYVYSPLAGCIQPILQHCKTYNSDRKCTLCDDEYYPYIAGDSCRKCTLSNCKTCQNEDAKSCTACKDGFMLGTYKDGNKFCFPISDLDPNCLTADENASTGLGASIFKCTSCAQTQSSGYTPKTISTLPNAGTLANTFCMRNVFNVADCKIYDNSKTELAQNSFDCLQCSTPLRYLTPVCLTCGTNQLNGLNGQSCEAFPIKVLNCRNYSSTTTCESCEPHYFLSNNVCEPVTTVVDFCLKYSNESTCAACLDSFWLNTAANTCHKITVTNCSVYVDQSKCSQCKDGYLVNSQTQQCDKITAVDCKTYTDYQTCATCENNMFLQTTAGVTSCILVNRSGCTGSYSSTKPFCSGCIDGFAYDSIQGICTQVVVEGCATFSGAICTGCVTNKFLINDKCEAPTVSINKCDVYATQTTCKTCQTGFVTSTNKQACVSASNIAGCVELDTVPEKCKTCNTGLFPKNNDGTSCVSPVVISNCKTYSGEITCSVCNDNYRLETNQCNLQQTISKCTSYASSTTCGTCETGYVPNGTICRLVVTNCEVISTQSTCQKCMTGYLLSEDKTRCDLITPVARCNVYATPTTCKICESGYLPNGTLCSQIVAIANCAAWSAYNTCSGCVSGFFLFANTCTNIANCIDHEVDGSLGVLCKGCVKPLVVSADRKSCLDSYNRYLDGKCLASRLMAAPVCTLCAPGFYFGGTGACTSCSASTPSDGCYSCDPANQSVCLLCRTGYYQTAAGKCVQNVVLLDTDSATVSLPASNSTNTNNSSSSPVSNTTNITNISNSTSSSNSTGSNNLTDIVNQNDSGVVKRSFILISSILSFVLFFVI